MDGELGVWFSLDADEFCIRVAEVLRVSAAGSEKWKWVIVDDRARDWKKGVDEKLGDDANERVNSLLRRKLLSEIVKIY